VYNRELLRLALRLAEQGRLADPDGSAEQRSRACGSVVIADVRMDGDRIAAFGQEVRACAVGQASAAILGSHALGQTRERTASARDGLSAYFSGLSDDLSSWPELHLLSEVRPYGGRHAAALVPFDAALAAIDQAVSASRNAATSSS
jgi:NifU-like protein involved in Fe-S cluster formation